MAEIPNIKPANKSKDRNAVEEERRVEKVTKGTAKKKQSTALQKFAKGFIPEDSKSIKEYVVEEAPGFILSFLRRLFQNLLDTYLPENGKYRDTTRRGSIFGSNSSVRYDKIQGSSASSGAGVRARSTNTVYEYENLTFEDYADAQEVLDGLYDCLDRYEKVRVLDLYDLAGVCTTATDRNYGWTDLRGVRIISTKEGWVIDLPRAIPLF